MAPYPLQTLLELRERTKQEAEAALCAAMRALEQDRAELERRAEALERCRALRKASSEAAFQEVMARGAVIERMGVLSRYEQRLKDDELQAQCSRERQERVVKAAESLVEQRRGEMVEALKAFEAVEKHREGWSRRVRAAQRVREERVEDEIGNVGFFLRQRK